MSCKESVCKWKSKETLPRSVTPTTFPSVGPRCQLVGKGAVAVQVRRQGLAKTRAAIKASNKLSMKEKTAACPEGCKCGSRFKGTAGPAVPKSDSVVLRVNIKCKKKPPASGWHPTKSAVFSFPYAYTTRLILYEVSCRKKSIKSTKSKRKVTKRKAIKRKG